MVLKKSIVRMLIFLVVLLQSCKGDVKLDSVFEEETTTTTIIGTKHFLEEDGIQIQLPENFKRLSIAEYIEILNQKKSKSSYTIEREELKNVRSLDGNNYLFFDEEKKATYFINTIPYSEIKKEDAQKLLGIIRQNHADISEKHKVKFEKITAKFNSGTRAQLFKAIFKADFQRPKKTLYQHSYFINSNEKSVLIKLITPDGESFDNYIQKMIF